MATVGEDFVEALAAKDADALRALLADGVDFMGLTPGRHWQAASPSEVVDDVVLGHWFDTGDDIREVRAVSTGRVADREHVAYRLGVLSGGRPHVVEQQCYYVVEDGRITWMRVLCSGFRPEPDA